VVGVVVIVIVMALIAPVILFAGGAIWSALFGWLIADDVDSRAETAS
jgi:hypothetical protein